MALICGASPALAIVGATSTSAVPVSYGQREFGLDLSGVVEILSAVSGCSGSLLGGNTILTAGHCVTSSFGAGVNVGAITVNFLGPSGLISDTVSIVAVNPGWTGDATQGGDLAVLQLAQAAPAFATPYVLYDSTLSNLGGPEVLAGWGLTGTGTTGAIGGFGTLRVGLNQYMTNGSSFGWTPNLLMGQFYDPSFPSTNAFGVTTPFSDPNQVDIAHGDSGGPSFYNGQIVGVHDVIACEGEAACDVPPSISSVDNSFFGQFYGDTSVLGYSSWIEAQIPTPEPSSLALVIVGFAAGATAVRKRWLRA